MNLNRLATECGLGYLMDPRDEFFAGDKLIALADKIKAAERERWATDVHSCHPNCSRAGCVNARLRVVALQVLRDMQSQSVLIEWQTSLAEALEA